MFLKQRQLTFLTGAYVPIEKCKSSMFDAPTKQNHLTGINETVLQVLLYSILRLATQQHL